MRRFFGSTGSVHCLTIDSQVLDGNMLGDPTRGWSRCTSRLDKTGKTCRCLWISSDLPAAASLGPRL
jgi:hypothetical protein